MSALSHVPSLDRLSFRLHIMPVKSQRCGPNRSNKRITRNVITQLRAVLEFACHDGSELLAADAGPIFFCFPGVSNKSEQKVMLSHVLRASDAVKCSRSDVVNIPSRVRSRTCPRNPTRKFFLTKNFTKNKLDFGF